MYAMMSFINTNHAIGFLNRERKNVKGKINLKGKNKKGAALAHMSRNSGSGSISHENSHLV
jgi:hypothetical protein